MYGRHKGKRHVELFQYSCDMQKGSIEQEGMKLSWMFAIETLARCANAEGGGVAKAVQKRDDLTRIFIFCQCFFYFILNSI